MNTFFKTFFICLVFSFGFLCYKFFSEESYNSDLTISKNSPIFGIPEEVGKPIGETPIQPAAEPDASQAKESQAQKPTTTENKTYTHSCFFYSHEGKLIQVNRELKSRPTTENAINLLLKGPLISETKKGIYSEIPANVDLISLKVNDKSVIVDLSSNFGNGGGTQSVLNRVQQLAKTIKATQYGKDVYLYINGKEVEYLGGDGVYIKQPLE